MTELIPLIDFLIKEAQWALNPQTIGKLTILFTFLFLLPITLSILHYLRTKLKDYLLLVGFLVCWMANTFSSLLYTPGVIINEREVAFVALSIHIVSMFLQYFFGTILFIRIHWEKPPIILFFVTVFMLILNIIVVYPAFLLNNLRLDIPRIDTSVLDFVMIHLWRLGVALLFCYVFFRIEPVIPYKSTQRTLLLWRIAAMLFLAFAIYMLIPTFPVGQVWGFFDDETRILINEIGSGMTTIVILLLLLITTCYPESLLITQVQVLRACKLYTQVKTYPLEAQPSHWTLSNIKDYIRSIPESFWAEGCE